MVLIDTSRGLRQQIYLQYFLAYFGIIASSCHVLLKVIQHVVCGLLLQQIETLSVTAHFLIRADRHFTLAITCSEQAEMCDLFGAQLGTDFQSSNIVAFFAAPAAASSSFSVDGSSARKEHHHNNNPTAADSNRILPKDQKKSLCPRKVMSQLRIKKSA